MNSDLKKDLHESIERIGDELKRDRDELNLQIHLAGAEVREEWHEVEKKWESFRSSSKRMGQAAGESSGDIGSALVALGDELKEAYKKIKKSM